MIATKIVADETAGTKVAELAAKMLNLFGRLRREVDSQRLVSPLRSSAGISCPPPHDRNGRTESAPENEIRPRKTGECVEIRMAAAKKRGITRGNRK